MAKRVSNTKIGDVFEDSGVGIFYYQNQILFSYYSEDGESKYRNHVMNDLDEEFLRKRNPELYDEYMTDKVLDGIRQTRMSFINTTGEIIQEGADLAYYTGIGFAVMALVEQPHLQ